MQVKTVKLLSNKPKYRVLRNRLSVSRLYFYRLVATDWVTCGWRGLNSLLDVQSTRDIFYFLHQWYWTYEYTDTLDGSSAAGDSKEGCAPLSLNFESYMVPTDSLEAGDLRLLETDNRVVLPVDTLVRVIVTGADVIHSWAVPSLGVKIDAIPGRLNQTSLDINREGVYYGQCSELCGVNHAFMPITVEGVSLEAYISWLLAQTENFFPNFALGVAAGVASPIVLAKTASNKNLPAINTSSWVYRWIYSTNARDIGVLYLIFAGFSGMIGTAFSMIIRFELSSPGFQFLQGNYQLYNVIITAHAFLMIFFLVENSIYDSKTSSHLFFKNFKPYFLFKRIGVSNFTPFNFNYNSLSAKALTSARALEKKNQNFNYIKILVEDPFNNRNILKEVSKGQKGVYIWETLKGEHYMYVGHSINLYNRISSYFMPSILNTKARKVLRYLNSSGFANIKLTIYVLPLDSKIEKVVELEQHFIDLYKPNLNVDLIATGTGFHSPMSAEMREKRQKERGTPVYLYLTKDLSLLYIFESKESVYKELHMHHKTLKACLDYGHSFLDSFFFSLDVIEESKSKEVAYTDLLQLKDLVKRLRSAYRTSSDVLWHSKQKRIYAEAIDDKTLNKEFSSLNSLAKHLKGDRQVIREYLKGEKIGYYRGKWKFTYIDSALLSNKDA